MKVTAADFVRRWNIPYSGRYSEWGNWFAMVTTFPCALIDTNGYVIFQSEESLRSCSGIKVTKQINVPDGISSLPGYVNVVRSLPEEIAIEDEIYEGAKASVTVNRYERNPKARKACIRHYGYRCSVCDRLAQDMYGADAATLIHVHHTKPVADNSGPYIVDPKRDLRPVCPNCHSFIHLYRPPLNIDDARSRIKNAESTK